MSEEQKKAVSVLMDDELPTAEMQDVISTLKSDASLRTTWQNYHLISAILQNSLASDWLSSEITASICGKTTEIVIEKNQSCDKTPALRKAD